MDLDLVIQKICYLKNSCSQTHELRTVVLNWGTTGFDYQNLKTLFLMSKLFEFRTIFECGTRLPKIHPGYGL